MVTSLLVPAALPAFMRAVTAGVAVVVASVLAEAAGPFWGALVISLPVAAGPAYAFMALDHGREFIAGAALNGFAANAATGLFLIAYARCAPGRTRAPALAAAALTWLASAAAIATVSWTPLAAFLLNVLVYATGLALVRPAPPQATSARAAAPGWPDLVGRAVAVALFVTALLAFSTALGPARTGVVAAFPVTITSTFVILHPRLGGAAMARLASAALRGLFGFGLTLLTLHLLVQPWGAGVALASALLLSLAWSAGLLALRHQALPERA